MKSPLSLRTVGVAGPGREAGFSIPFLTIGIVAAVLGACLVLDLNLGWIGALALLGIGVRVALGRQEQCAPPLSGGTGVVSRPDATSSMPDPNAPCRTCGARLFLVVPGHTSAAAIRAFAASSGIWSVNPDALEGWMPPGCFCPNGCVSILATPGPPGLAQKAAGQ